MPTNCRISIIWKNIIAWERDTLMEYWRGAQEWVRERKKWKESGWKSFPRKGKGGKDNPEVTSYKLEAMIPRQLLHTDAIGGGEGVITGGKGKERIENVGRKWIGEKRMELWKRSGQVNINRKEEQRKIRIGMEKRKYVKGEREV